MKKRKPTDYLSAGIDVSSEKLDVFLMNKEEEGIHKIFLNTEEGIRKIIKWLKDFSFEGKIVMESTGRYHELVAVMLFEAGGNVFVINPLRAKKYTTAQIRKLKTDKNDAKILAEMALKEKTLDAFTLTRKEIEVKKRIAFARSLEKKIQELNAMVNNYQSSQEKLGHMLSETEKKIKDAIKSFEKEKRVLEKEIIKAVFNAEDTKAQKAKDILNSISGISPYYAALLYFFYSLNRSKSSGSWIAYTGLEISIAESGKWRGKGKLSKRGNKYLRKRNFGADWGAIMNDSAFRQYYDTLKEKGRSHTEALTITGRKILRIAHSCLKYQKYFDPTILENSLLVNKINH